MHILFFTFLFFWWGGGPPDCMRHVSSIGKHNDQPVLSKSLQSVRKVIWCVIVSPICILLLDFQHRHRKKKKKDFCRFNLTGKIDYCHYCHLYNFYKSLFKLSDWNPHYPWGEVSFRLDIWGIFTPVQPRLYWGSPSVSSQRPVSSLLETDLGTVIKLLSIKVLIQNNCSFFSIFHVMWPNRFCFHKNI